MNAKTAGKKLTGTDALIQLYYTVNGPRTAGRKWVTYSRPQVDAMLDVLKQILKERGCESRPDVGDRA